MAGTDKTTARLERVLGEDGDLDSIRALVREALDADTPMERVLTLRSAVAEVAGLQRALRRCAIASQDVITMAQMREGGRESLGVLDAEG